MSKASKVEISKKKPADYHCSCQYCQRWIGELRPTDGTYYSRLERNQYYDSTERGDGGHIAKTPLHLARWAVQTYTREGDWVLDPTLGAGTTAVESLTQGRNVAGMELQYSSILQSNIEKNVTSRTKAIVRVGDARNVARFLAEEKIPRVQLVINNPPYSGDEAADGKAGKKYFYDTSLPNIAFLREGKEYWQTIRSIYSSCADHLVPGGHFVIGVKDMMRDKVPYLLHQKLCDVLTEIGLEIVGTAVLHHYPRTLFMNTYYDRYGVHPPYYQSINVFRKPRGLKEKMIVKKPLRRSEG